MAVGTNPYCRGGEPGDQQDLCGNDGSGNVTVIDGATNTVTTRGRRGPIRAVAVNPVTDKIYVANYGSNNVTVIDEQQVQNVPLYTYPWNDGLSNGLSCEETSGITTCYFTLSPWDSFSPHATVPNSVYFQVDTWQGAWTAMTLHSYIPQLFHRSNAQFSPGSTFSTPTPRTDRRPPQPTRIHH